MEQNHSAIRTFMTIMAERDAAIRERNMAIEERKRAFAERDMAMLQRDAALAEYNSALQERDEAMACLRSKGSSVNDNNNMTPNFPGNGAKDIHHEQPELKYSPRETLADDPIQITEVPFEAVKPRKIKVKHTKESKKNSGNIQVKIEDDSGMPIPVCSCTGVPQPCYKWGDGGWQSACCTTTMSHVSGRKMSGNSFGKLLNRLHDEGYDLSGPVDLKEYWGKYGTNR